MKYFYKDASVALIQANAFKILEKLPNNYVDQIILDPPYFLSKGGFTNCNGNIVSVNKGKWDDPRNVDVKVFYKDTLKECQRILKSNGTIWIFGTFHNIYLIGALLEELNLKIINNITWRKSNPSPNLSHRMFTHSTETILWVKKQGGKQTYNYLTLKRINNNCPMTDVWTTTTIKNIEKSYGYHPTQKPLALIIRILQSCISTKDMIVLDPFAGSGTTCVASKILGLNSIGIEKEYKYLKTAKERIINYDKAFIDKIW